MKITASSTDYALIQYQPKTPIIERLEWMTDVFIGNDGTETRTQKRSNPRQIFEYTFPLAFWRKIDTVNTVKGAIRNDFAIPIWTEGQFVGNLSNGQTQILCDTSTEYWLPVGSFVYLYSENGNNQFGEIEVRYSNAVQLTAGVTAQTSVYLMPLRFGYIVGNPKHITNGLESVVEVKFALYEPHDIGANITLPMQFEEDDIYYFQNGSNNRKISKDQEIIDFELGYTKSLSSHENTDYFDTLRFVLQGSTEIREYKEFLFRRLGRFLNFWLPTFENDVENLSTGTITTTMLVSRDSIDEYALDYAYICIFTSDGNYHPVLIDSIEIIDSDRVQFNFDSSLGIDASDILMISYLNFNRLDTDSVELRWIGNHIVESEVVYIQTNLYSEKVIIVE